MKHTKGPWGIYNRWLVTANSDGSIPLNARVLSDKNTIDGLSDADLRLVVTAPEMFELLQEVVACGPNVGHNVELLQEIKTLTDKVQGIVP